jgi:hypothetical protein
MMLRAVYYRVVEVFQSRTVHARNFNIGAEA